MRIVSEYSHLNGYEWLKVHQPVLIKEIRRVISEVDATTLKTKESKERTKKGKLVYSPTLLNKAFKAGFNALGWRESNVSHWVTSDYELTLRTVQLTPEEQFAEITEAQLEAIRSKNQTDFVKNGVAVEVQFGKYSFIAYDLFVKHLAFYVSRSIEVGIEIVPMKAMQDFMSSGPGYYEKTLHDLARAGRGVPAVPLWILGVDA